MRPHTPTRFPYTTLFRSRRPQLRPQRPVRQRSFSCERNESLRAAFNARHSFTIPTVVNSFQKFSLWERLDRKSTRLNSSHLGISYAVFCLKKKTHIK